MKKQDALEALEIVITQKWKDAQSAFESSKAGATSTEVKQESKYDTRGLEESYLAHGLANSVREFENALNDLNQCRLAPMTGIVTTGSFITCKRGAENAYFLLSESGGGIEANVQGEEVTIITPQSPIAQKLSGKAGGEHISSPMLKIISVT